MSDHGFVWEKATPESQGLDRSHLERARDYALTGGGSGCVVFDGKVVMTWGDDAARYDIKSSTKSIGVTALGLAISDGLVKLEDRARQSCEEIAAEPNLGDSRVDAITLKHLATMTAGFPKTGGCEKLVFAPGTTWAYTDGGANWLADCMTLAFGRDLKTLMFDRVFGPLGIAESDLTWRKNAYRSEKIQGMMRYEFGAGIHATAEALAKIGYLYLCRGSINGQQILPASFVDAVRQPVADVKGLPVENWTTWGSVGASDHYGLLWWNNADGSLASVPKDAFWSFGLHDSLILVIPSLNLVAARAGSDWSGNRHPSYYNVLGPFMEPLVKAVT